MNLSPNTDQYNDQQVINSICESLLCEDDQMVTLDLIAPRSLTHADRRALEIMNELGL